jgi:hypothetical protein
MKPLRRLLHRYGCASVPAFALLCVFCLWLAGCAPAIPSPATETPPAAQQEKAPTLDDFWEGAARFELEIVDTGLPLGESDTVVLGDGSWRTYVHASHQSLGVVDQCGEPVEFPGCLVIFTSTDRGQTFTPTRKGDGIPLCQIQCVRCPCDSRRDHIDQQQYPRVAWLHDTGQWLLAYEYRANTFLRRSRDGLNWSSPAEVPLTGIWRQWLMPCPSAATIGEHPYAPALYDCLIGSPPGIFVDESVTPPQLYIFAGMGQNPSSMGCYRAQVNAPPSLLRACDHNPLFTGATDYGPLEDKEAGKVNAHFDFRTISSAEVVQVNGRYYLFYEGVRGPQAGDAGDTQFLLGLARSTGPAIDGPWELLPSNPILLDLPGNVGVGHADVVILDGKTFLYTSLDGANRSRLRLVWK